MRKTRNIPAHLQSSLPPSLLQYVPNEHVSSRTHFILFNWSSHPSWGDPICGAFNLRGPLIITVAHRHSPCTYSSHQRTENVKVDCFSTWIWNSKWWEMWSIIELLWFNCECKRQSLTGSFYTITNVFWINNFCSFCTKLHTNTLLRTMLGVSVLSHCVINHLVLDM